MNNHTRDDDDFHARRIAAARAQWRWVGEERPPFALKPEPMQESVWDYPRPPRLASDGREVIVMAGDVEVARSCSAVRVLETASPPGFYLPPGDVRVELLSPAAGQSFCEWKGDAQYWSVRARDRWLEGVAWSYPEPLSGFEVLAGYMGFYPQHLACFVDGVRVQPQPGRFYAGWITPEIVGPSKGEPGSGNW